MAQPDLSIIIVNYHSMPELGVCLTSLAAVRNECAFEVIVVDNNSADDSLQVMQTGFPWCRFVPLDLNYGFARASNEGLRIARGRHAMLLNPDTELTPGALPKLILVLEDHPTWGIVGPRMVDENGHAYAAARRLPTPWYLFCETTGLARLFSHSRLINGYQYGDRDEKALDEVEQIEGSALVISEKARQRIGNLDPQFFLFFEEVDWCQRTRDEGFAVHVVPDATVKHHRSSTMSRFFVESRVHHAESAMKYFRKHHGVRGLRRLRRWMKAGLRIRIMLLRIGLLFKHTPEMRLRLDGTQAMRRTYRRGLIV